MTIWIDADATPRPVNEMLIRASHKRKVALCFVANRYLAGLTGPMVSVIKVEAGADKADDYIAEHCTSGDLVVSADIPLAARVIHKGALILQPRGRVLDEDSIDEALSLRDFKESLRSGGVETGGPPPFGPKEKARFANGLDRYLTMNGH